MKVVTVRTQSPAPHNRGMFITITEQPAGKPPKIQIHNVREYRWVEENHARKLAAEVIAANYVHPAVASLSEPKAGLVEMIKAQTGEMLERFLLRTEVNSREDFAYCEKCLKRTDAEWYEAYGVQTEIKTRFASTETYIEPVSAEYHKKPLYKMRAAKEKMFKVVSKGVDDLIKKNREKAILHYEHSTNKLARRITDLGFETEKTVVTSGYVGVNLELLITDGTKNLKCFTIVAEGAIQQAHYRYLIKNKK